MRHLFMSVIHVSRIKGHDINATAADVVNDEDDNNNDVHCVYLWPPYVIRGPLYFFAL